MRRDALYLTVLYNWLECSFGGLRRLFTEATECRESKRIPVPGTPLMRFSCKSMACSAKVADREIKRPSPTILRMLDISRPSACAASLIVT